MEAGLESGCPVPARRAALRERREEGGAGGGGSSGGLCGEQVEERRLQLLRQLRAALRLEQEHCLDR